MIKLTYPGVGKVLYLGAEAAIILGELWGLKVIYKIRIPKPYRDEALDKQIRSLRTKNESKIMILAHRLGVNVPSILFVDLDNALIVMEYIEGPLLRDYLNKLDVKLSCKIIGDVGMYAGILHKNGIIHGDLTTSNMVLSVREGKVYIIDFGLAKISKSIEDIGVDVHLFLRSLESVHFNVKDKLFKCFIDGYEQILGRDYVNEVLKKVEEIRLRGRYVEERKLRKIEYEL